MAASSRTTAAATAATAAAFEPPANVVKDLRVAIVGASLGGLSVANVLHRLGGQVEVFEYYPHSFHDRGGALGNVDVGLLASIRGDNGDGELGL